MQALFENYLAVLLAAGTGCILVITAILGTRLLAPFSQNRGKGTPYECGMLPIGRVRTQIHIRYYVYAILFLIFDVEAVFLFPWVVSFVQLGDTALLLDAALYRHSGRRSGLCLEEGCPGMEMSESNQPEPVPRALGPPDVSSRRRPTARRPSTRSRLPQRHG